MNFASFHKSLVGSDPTPLQSVLYQRLEAKTDYGFLGGTHNPEVFEAVFIAALALTVDPITKDYRPVYLFHPKEAENTVTEKINEFLRKLRKIPIAKELKARRNKGLVKAMEHILRGSNIPRGSKAPAHWMAYGYATETKDFPQWIRDALVIY